MIDQYSEIKEATDEEIEKEVEEEEKEETPTAPLIKTGLFAILLILIYY